MNIVELLEGSLRGLIRNDSLRSVTQMKLCCSMRSLRSAILHNPSIESRRPNQQDVKPIEVEHQKDPQTKMDREMIKELEVLL